MLRVHAMHAFIHTSPLQLRARNDALEEEVARMDARTVGVKASLEKRISVIGAVRVGGGR